MTVRGQALANIEVGSRVEHLFCDILYEHGYWTHNFANKTHGQPCDVIAVKNKKAYIIDCKHCKNDFFKLSRVESNQFWSMSMWYEMGNGYGWFAIYINKEFYMLSFKDIMYAFKTDKRQFTYEEIKEIAIPLEEWFK